MNSIHFMPVFTFFLDETVIFKIIQITDSVCMFLECNKLVVANHKSFRISKDYYKFSITDTVKLQRCVR